MATYETSDFRNGLKIEIDGTPYTISWFQFVKPGKGNAFTRTKLKSMLSGSVLERTFRTGETVQAADVEEMFMQFLYSDGETFHFMNSQTYEQVGIPGDSIKYEAQFLTENLDVTVLFYKGKAVSINLPFFIKSEITYCEPGMRGNTATGATKPATIATGATIQVPLFVEQGDIIQVDTRTAEYIGRVKDE